MQMMHLRSPCDHCRESVSYSADQAGKRVRCPKCKQVFRLPPLEILEANSDLPPMKVGFQINTSPHIPHGQFQRGQRLPVTGIVISLALIIGASLAIGFVLYPALNPASPSEIAAKQKRERIAKAGDSPFAVFAAAATPDSSLNVGVTGQPTIEIGEASRFGDYDPSLGDFAPTIRLSFSITNRSRLPISSLQARYQFIQKGRSIELCGADFFKRIASGIEPGETSQFQITAPLTSEMAVIMDSEHAKSAVWEIYIQELFSRDLNYTSSQPTVELNRIYPPHFLKYRSLLGIDVVNGQLQESKKFRTITKWDSPTDQAIWENDREKREAEWNLERSKIWKGGDRQKPNKPPGMPDFTTLEKASGGKMKIGADGKLEVNLSAEDLKNAKKSK